MSEASVKKALQDPLVAEASKALGGYFTNTIEALGQDVQKLLAANGQPPDSTAIAKLTADMIAELGARVKSVIGK